MERQTHARRRTSNAVTYREARLALRRTAREQIADAISDTIFEHRRTKRAKRALISPGREVEDLYDGIAQAIAESIVLHARDGHAQEMAGLVAVMLQDKVDGLLRRAPARSAHA